MSSRAFSIRPFSAVANRRLLVAVTTALALCAAIFAGVSAGSTYIGPATVWDALWSQADPTSNLIVREIRIPRVLLGAMVGASLAMSGAILQGITRNPLADPHILGISAGAALVAVCLIVLAPSVANERVEVDAMRLHLTTLNPVQPLALLGGLAAGALAYVLAWRGGVTPVRLALVGIAVTSMLLAVTAGVLVTSAFSAQVGLRWLIGGLSQRNWTDVEVMAPYFLLGCVLLLLMARQVNVIALGDELATALGQRVERTRFVLATIAALLASAAVSIAGLIGFVGLIVPHFVRLLIGNDYRLVVPASAVFGAILLVLADAAARTVVEPQELPVGVVTALLGGPVFVLLVRSRA